MNQNFKTPIKDIFFRSSKIGLLAGGLIRHGLTEKQRQEFDRLEAMKVEPIGLTVKQLETLMNLDKNIEDGKTLTPALMEKREDLRNRLTECKGLTPVQQGKLEELNKRNNRPPELSDGAKTYIKEVWLENEKGFVEEISSKHLRKGLQAEEDALNLISFVDGKMYIKNELTVRKGHLSGTCDVKHINKDIDAVVIDDTKCSWNPRTFMQSKLSTAYEWQGRAYLHLYNAEIFRLRFCLVDCPPDVYKDEFKRFCWVNNIIDETLPEYKELIEQFETNFLYENSGRYTQPERVKTFMFDRDYELEEILLKSIELGVEYYKTITLNMVE